MAKAVKKKKIPVRQGKSKTKAKQSSRSKNRKKTKRAKSKGGYKKPPKEHQFKPGQSGNPKGPPVHRVNLWPLFCGYMLLTDAEIGKLVLSKLSQAQQAALKLVENLKEGKYSGSQRLARHVFDREEGRPVEHLVIEQEDILTDEECEQIRETLKTHAH